MMFLLHKVLMAAVFLLMIGVWVDPSQAEDECIRPAGLITEANSDDQDTYGTHGIRLVSDEIDAIPVKGFISRWRMNRPSKEDRDPDEDPNAGGPQSRKFEEQYKSMPADPKSYRLKAIDRSEDMLVGMVEQALEVTSKRVLTANMHTPWQIFHGILALRNDLMMNVGNKRMTALDWISTSNPFYEGEYLFERTAYGGRTHKFTNPYIFEGHPNQFLGIMTMSDLPLDHKFAVTNGFITMEGIVKNAQMEINSQEEITWTLWFLSHYLEPDAEWTNMRGEPWGIEKMVRLQTQADVLRGACGGCHGLFALAFARNNYLKKTNQPLRGVWMDSEQKLQTYIAQAKSIQLADGSFPTRYFRGYGTPTSFSERLAAPGHMMEWLMIALPDERLKEPWVRKGIEFIARQLISFRHQQADCGPMYHALDALAIYHARMKAKSRIETKEEIAQTTPVVPTTPAPIASVPPITVPPTTVPPTITIPPSTMVPPSIVKSTPAPVVTTQTPMPTQPKPEVSVAEKLTPVPKPVVKPEPVDAPKAEVSKDVTNMPMPKVVANEPDVIKPKANKQIDVKPHPIAARPKATIPNAYPQNRPMPQKSATYNEFRRRRISTDQDMNDVLNGATTERLISPNSSLEFFEMPEESATETHTINDQPLEPHEMQINSASKPAFNDLKKPGQEVNEPIPDEMDLKSNSTPAKATSNPLPQDNGWKQRVGHSTSMRKVKPNTEPVVTKTEQPVSAPMVEPSVGGIRITDSNSTVSKSMIPAESIVPPASTVPTTTAEAPIKTVEKTDAPATESAVKSEPVSSTDNEFELPDMTEIVDEIEE
jgi:hypothetical protein